MKGIGSMFGRRGLLVALVACGSLGFASAASAATYNVNDTRDFPQSSTAASGACVSTASTCTLRAAFQAANENGGANMINVPAGTYPISSPQSGNPDDMTTGDFKVNVANNSTSITLVGAGSGATVINAQGKSRAIEVRQNGTLTISGFTLENGTTGPSDTSHQHDDGGAIDSEGHLSVSNVTFTGNSASAGGGAIEAEDTSGSTLSVTGSVFQNNTSNDSSGGGGGGAIADISPNDVTVSFSLFQANNAGYAGGAIAGCASGFSGCPGTSAAAGLTLNFDDFVQNVAVVDGGGGLAWAGNGAVNVSNSLFTQNQAPGSGGPGGVGGAIGNIGTANFNVSNTSFDGNSSAAVGGALFDVASNGMTLTQDKFSGNTAAIEGGALFLDSSASNYAVTSSEFDGNSAAGGSAPSSWGGAIGWASGTLTLLGDSFVLNTAQKGGALDADVNGSLFTMIDSTLSRNTASTLGGAIYVEEPMATTLTNDTIAFNNAPAGEGGGIYDPGAWSAGGSASNGFGVENTTIAENSGGDCGNSLFAKPVDVGNNNDSDQTCFGGVGGPNDKTGVNPLLANPGNNGGPAAGGPGDTETVQTDAEQASSPTVDAGNNNGCPAVDERGVSRPQGKACDIGAFEFGASPTSTTTATTSSNVTTTTSKTTVVTSTTTQRTTSKPCPKGKHKSGGRCVKNKKPKHKKKKKCGKGKVRKGAKCVKKGKKK